MVTTISALFQLLVTKGIFLAFGKILLGHYGVKTFLLMCSPLILDAHLGMVGSLGYGGINGLMV
ncbi:hypothetical protein CRYUN_Cryun38cG0029000 [Craigia yunnanensis]